MSPQALPKVNYVNILKWIQFCRSKKDGKKDDSDVATSIYYGVASNSSWSKLLIERQNRHYKNYRDIEDCCNVGETSGWLPYLPYDWVDHRW